MSKPHQKQCGALRSEAFKRQNGLLRVRSHLSKDTLSSLEELGEVLRGIHKRMIAEGYEMINGHIQKAK